MEDVVISFAGVSKNRREAGFAKRKHIHTLSSIHTALSLSLSITVSYSDGDEQLLTRTLYQGYIDKVEVKRRRESSRVHKE